MLIKTSTVNTYNRGELFCEAGKDHVSWLSFVYSLIFLSVPNNQFERERGHDQLLFDLFKNQQTLQAINAFKTAI